MSEFRVGAFAYLLTIPIESERERESEIESGFSVRMDMFDDYSLTYFDKRIKHYDKCISNQTRQTRPTLSTRYVITKH